MEVTDEEEGVAHLDAHLGPVTSLAYSASGERLVTGSADKTLRLWDMNTGTKTNEYVGGQILKAHGALSLPRRTAWQRRRPR